MKGCGKLSVVEFIEGQVSRICPHQPVWDSEKEAKLNGIQSYYFWCRWAAMHGPDRRRDQHWTESLGQLYVGCAIIRGSLMWRELVTRSRNPRFLSCPSTYWVYPPTPDNGSLPLPPIDSKTTKLGNHCQSAQVEGVSTKEVLSADGIAVCGFLQ